MKSTIWRQTGHFQSHSDLAAMQTLVVYSVKED